MFGHLCILYRAYMNDLENRVESQLCASGSISIVMLSQQMKLPYSLLKLVRPHPNK